jgi:hypothetical protein
MFATRKAVQRWKFMDSFLSFYFERVYISLMMPNVTRNSTFVSTELVIDGPEEYNHLGSAFVSIY